MSAPPFMQLWVADYLGDTRHLTCEQHGAYLLLLMSMWRAGGSVSNEPRMLARLACCTPSRWSKIAPEVLDLLTLEGDQISHPRIKAELTKASEKSIKRAEAGTRGGVATSKVNSLKNNDTAPAIATRLPQHSSDTDIELSLIHI